ncbi:MAG: aldo/keto reductase, partial [uncultured bacterium]
KIYRNKIIIATKCGIIRDENDSTKRGVDNSYQYVKDCCEKSLVRLGKEVGRIDLYYLHRIAHGGKQIDEAMKAMSELLSENKIKSAGLSEANAEIIQHANDALLKYSNGKHQLAAVQSEYSLMTRNIESNGVLALCKKLGISFVAYSPLSRALLSGEIVDIEKLPEGDFRKQLPRFQKENLTHNNTIILKVKELASQKNCSTAQIALAWVMQHDNVIPIPGTTKEKNLLSNIRAQDIRLTDGEIKSLNELQKPIGDRYTESSMKAFEFDE